MRYQQNNENSTGHSPRIILMIYTAILNKYGFNSADKYMNLLISSGYGHYRTNELLLDHDEINYMNSFWRHTLIQYENTLEIRSWLCDSDNSHAYVHTFDKHWLPLIYELGILS